MSCYVRWARSVQTHVLGAGLWLRAQYFFIKCKNFVGKWDKCFVSMIVIGVLFALWLWMIMTEENNATVVLLSVVVLVLFFLFSIVSSIMVKENV